MTLCIKTLVGHVQDLNCVIIIKIMAPIGSRSTNSRTSHQYFDCGLPHAPLGLHFPRLRGLTKYFPPPHQGQGTSRRRHIDGWAFFLADLKTYHFWLGRDFEVPDQFASYPGWAGGCGHR